jgi:EAL domain-containing protein (putative c-di-GMP-specific phosphodiesterase class I)
MRVHYQPIVNIDDGRIRGVEALVRWQHPERGLLAAADFVGLAERLGLIDEIGEWVLEHACRQVAQWQGPDRPPLDLNVNVSSHQLTGVKFAEAVAAILERTALDPRRLVLELTEHAVVDDHVIGQVALLRDAGVRIALDDFGSGYPALRCLSRLPVDILKLDRCFVSELDGTVAASAVADAVLRLGEALQVEIVAEGVEDAAQVRELTRLGCRTAQGYHFARPMSAEALMTLLDQLPPSMPPLANSTSSDTRHHR